MGKHAGGHISHYLNPRPIWSDIPTDYTLFRGKVLYKNGFYSKVT
jgi:hypothetical protein